MREYRGSITAKITASIIWVFILFGAGITTYVLVDLENNIAGDFARDADHLALMIQREAATASDPRDLENRVRTRIFPQFRFSRIEIGFGANSQIYIGEERGPKQVLVNLDIMPTVPVAGRGDELNELRIRLYHPPVYQIIKEHRNRIIMTFGFPLLGIAAALFLITHRIITRPLLRVVKAIRRISEGDMSERVDIQRNDELGTLVGFFNNMLDELSNREQVLRDEIRMRVKTQDALTHHSAALERTNAELKTFSYTVSHDLRAPLRAIKGFSEALEEDCGGQLDDTGKMYLERIIRASDRMDRLIRDILDLSRVSRQELSLSEVDLSELARDLCRQKPGSLRDDQVKVQIDAPLKVTGDKSLLNIMLDNLLSNAWKYTRRVEEPRIRIGKGNDLKGNVYFYIKDNGVGFDMHNSQKLFAPFERLHSGAEYEGSGIGLATVQRIVHRHRGKIWADSEPGQGACFYFSLPERGEQSL